MKRLLSLRLAHSLCPHAPGRLGRFAPDGRLLVLALALFPIACQPALPGTPGDRAGLVPVHVQDKDGAALGGPVEVAAIAYLRSNRDVIGLESDELEVISSVHGIDGLDHVRVRQTVQGLPIYGSEIVVHAGASSVRNVGGSVARGLDTFATQPVINETEAHETARADYSLRAKTGEDLEFSRESIELYILPTPEHGMRLSWKVTFFTELQAGINPGLWTYFVDAGTGEILRSWNSLHSLTQASGVGGNAKVNRMWTGALDVEATPAGLYEMNTMRLRTENMQNETKERGKLVSATLDGFADRAINDAHAHAEISLNVMRDWFEFDSIDGRGMQIVSRVHYGEKFENAFWDGLALTYGDGDQYLYPLSGALDVAAHEMNHGFTQHHSNLVYAGQSGGLNESFSDVAGTAAEWFLEPASADFLIGEDLTLNPQVPILRDMCNPPADGFSLEHVGQVSESTDPHESSGVGNKAFCRAAKRLSSGSPDGVATADGVRRAAKAWYAANAHYWTGSSKFQEGCDGVIDAAKAMQYPAADVIAIRDSWSDVGVYCADAIGPVPPCTFTMTTSSGEIATANPYADNTRSTWCIQPADGMPVTLRFTSFDTEGPNDFVVLYQANGKAITYGIDESAPAPFTSTSIYVTFITDAQTTAAGFTASWKHEVQNLAPEIAFLTPANGAQISGTVTISATASDADGSIERVNFLVPGTNGVASPGGPFSYDWDTTRVADGTYTLSAVAHDNFGSASGIASRVVQVNNGQPCVTQTILPPVAGIAIPDNTEFGAWSPAIAGGPGTVRELKLTLDLQHTYLDDLEVYLLGPGDGQLLLHNRTGGSSTNLQFSMRTITGLEGKPVAGTWGVFARDLSKGDTGILYDWSLEIVPSCVATAGSWLGELSPALPLVDFGRACSTLQVVDEGDAAAVRFDMSGTHTAPYVLKGTLSHGGITRDVFAEWDLHADPLFGIDDLPVAGFSGTARGEWTLCVTDVDPWGDFGTLSYWSVHP